MELSAAPDALSFEADIRDVQHCGTREGPVGPFYLARKRGTAAIADEFDLHKLDRDKLPFYVQKYPRLVKFELLESLARTDAVLSNGKSSRKW
jgi:hypothetical protein